MHAHLPLRDLTVAIDVPLLEDRRQRVPVLGDGQLPIAVELEQPPLVLAPRRRLEAERDGDLLDEGDGVLHAPARHTTRHLGVIEHARS